MRNDEPRGRFLLTPPFGIPARYHERQARFSMGRGLLGELAISGSDLRNVLIRGNKSVT